MSSDVITVINSIRKIVTLGVTHEAILLTLDSMEIAYNSNKSKGAQRQQRYRDRRNAGVTSVTGESVTQRNAKVSPSDGFPHPSLTPPAKEKTPLKGVKKESIPQNQPGEAFKLPSFIDPELWQAWLDVRKKKKAPATAKAFELAVKELKRIWEADKIKPNETLEHCIRNGYQGIFAPNKRDTRGNGAKPPQSSGKGALTV